MNISTNEYNTLLKKTINSDMAPIKRTSHTFTHCTFIRIPDAVSIFDK